MKDKVYDVFDIDLNRLEEECADQSLLYIEYSEKLKSARNKESEAKADMELTEAEIGLAIRKNPSKYKLPKDCRITESMISTTVLTTKKYKKVRAEYMKTKGRADTLQTYVNALEHRKRMITNLQELHGQQYWSKPFVPSGYRKVVREAEKMAARSKKKKKGKNN